LVPGYLWVNLCVTKSAVNTVFMESNRLIACLKRELAQADTAIESLEVAIERAHAKRIANSIVEDDKVHEINVVRDPSGELPIIPRLACSVRLALVRLSAAVRASDLSRADDSDVAAPVTFNRPAQ
jgi:hypothetical protein